MMRGESSPATARQSGLAAVEFALLLPLLLLLLMAAADLARGVQANMILINMSREGANLASRGSMQLSDNSQAIIGSVAATAPPLNMNTLGMIYVTRIMGSVSGGVSRSLVIEQYRWDDSVNNQGFRVSGYAPASRIWSCTNWSTTPGVCSVPTGTSAPAVALMGGTLADGEVIYAVETYYKFDMLFSTLKLGKFSMPAIGPNLYSMTVF